MMPASVRGVINLRGAVVPVMDLLARFGRPASDVTKRTCIVIVRDRGRRSETPGDRRGGRRGQRGARHRPPPTSNRRPVLRREHPHRFRSGAWRKVKGKFVILLNVHQVLSIDDLQAATGPRRKAVNTSDRTAPQGKAKKMFSNLVNRHA